MCPQLLPRSREDSARHPDRPPEGLRPPRRDRPPLDTAHAPRCRVGGTDQAGPNPHRDGIEPARHRPDPFPGGVEGSPIGSPDSKALAPTQATRSPERRVERSWDRQNPQLRASVRDTGGRSGHGRGIRALCPGGKTLRLGLPKRRSRRSRMTRAAPRAGAVDKLGFGDPAVRKGMWHFPVGWRRG